MKKSKKAEAEKGNPKLAIIHKAAKNKKDDPKSKKKG